jgi:hypothetical protein
MCQITRFPVATASLLLALGMGLTPSHLAAASLTPEVRAELSEFKQISPDLIDALEHHERVSARVSFRTPPPSRGEVPALRQSRDGAPLSPVVIELTQAFLPGQLKLLHQNGFDALQGTVDSRIVQLLLQKPYVVSIDLDNTAPEIEEESLITKAACSPTSTRACVQGGRFSIQVFFSGSTSAVVASSSSESAVFWFYSSTNWEVVAKVINACSINNRFWIFGAGATTTTYSLNIADSVTGRSASYNGGVLCPIADTGQAGFPGFPCS